jgi:putative flavoprotein involved in K+ transport
MDTIGLLGETIDEIDDVERARRLPSLQLIGTPERRSLDLSSLRADGVEVVGRLVGVRDQTAMFAGSLANLVASADLKLGRLLDRIDGYATTHGLDDEVDPPDRPRPSLDFRGARNALDLGRFATIVWATGFRPDFPWLEPHLLDHRGGIRHDGGVMEEPGMYVLGLPVLRRRSSSFLDGVGRDAEVLVGHLARFLDACVSSRS